MYLRRRPSQSLFFFYFLNSMLCLRQPIDTRIVLGRNYSKSLILRKGIRLFVRAYISNIPRIDHCIPRCSWLTNTERSIIVYFCNRKRALVHVIAIFAIGLITSPRGFSNFVPASFFFEHFGVLRRSSEPKKLADEVTNPKSSVPCYESCRFEPSADAGMF